MSIPTKPFIFVLMPFTSDFDDVYKLGIKDTAEELNTYCERVDEQIFEERILDRIYNQINKADVIISDLTGKNPNVFYETGYAHALGKKVILLTQFLEDIPFDLRHHPHIIYEGKITQLKVALSKRISWLLNKPNLSVIPNDKNLEFYINGDKIEQDKIINISLHYITIHSAVDASLPFTINIHNTLSVVHATPIKVALITDQEAFDYQANSTAIILPDGSLLHSIGSVDTIYPDAWTSISVDLNLAKAFNSMEIWDNELNFRLKTFNEIEASEVKFKLRISQLPWD